jgi:hypothetical protein
MYLDKRQFPEGTRISRPAICEYEDYFNKKLPEAIYLANPAYMTQTYSPNYYILPLWTLDFSECEVFESSRLSATIKMNDDIVFSMPAMKKLTVKYLNLTKIDGTPLNITYEDMDSIEEINGSLESVVGKVTYRGQSTNLTRISEIFYTNKYPREMYFEIDCSKVTSMSPFGYGTFTEVTYISGFPNMKASIASSYSLANFPNLTYESCIDILNNLYDFTGNGEKPTSSQGKLKVHANFLSAVGDQISIATNKGWVVTA